MVAIGKMKLGKKERGMKLMSFGPVGKERPGVLYDRGTILDLELASEGKIQTIRGLLELGDSGLKQVRRWQSEPSDKWLTPLKGVRLGPPVTNPRTIVCLGLNYHCHAQEQGEGSPKRPILFSKAVTTLIGNGDPIIYPDREDHVDYEVELAFVIGRKAFRVDPEDWQSYVAGYTVVNDVSARDAQFGDRLWYRGKSCDTFCPMGPYLVTRDEIPDPHNLQVTATLNDEQRQNGHTSDLIFNIPKILSFASHNTTFFPGDVFSTGTPKGVGIFMDPQACMKPGDEISVHVEKIGTLTNRVQKRSQEH